MEEVATLIANYMPMKEILKMTIVMAKELGTVKTAANMREISRMINLTASVFLLKLKVILIKDNGRMVGL